MDLIATFADESVAYFAHFNAASQSNNNDDTCISLPELEEMLPSAPNMDPIAYCSNLYMSMYDITQYWWWQFRLPNCAFNFDSYMKKLPNGPAFDATPLFWQTTTGTDEVLNMFMWFMDGTCHFSLHHFANTAQAVSGVCEIEGHKTIGADHAL